MAAKLLVSVIIPTFNRLGFLKEAVESVEKQTYRDFALVMIDDGSTDGTRKYLESLPVKYSRMEHRGFPGRVVSQSKQCHKRSGYIFNHSLKKCIIGSSTVMVSGRLFTETGGFREDMEIAEDYELWLRITNGYEVGYNIDEPLVIKRGGHEDQLSEKYGQIEIFHIKALQQNLEAGIFHGENKILVGREIARKCQIYGAGVLKRRKTEEGKCYLRLAERC